MLTVQQILSSLQCSRQGGVGSLKCRVGGLVGGMYYACVCATGQQHLVAAVVLPQAGPCQLVF
jgi:hypothetical protein